MSTIYKMDEDEIGKIEDDGFVYDDGGEYLGKVTDGRVFDKASEYVGYIDDKGYVYDSHNDLVGIVGDDGIIRNQSDEELAHVESPHMQSGGAAYLLLFR